MTLLLLLACGPVVTPGKVPETGDPAETGAPWDSGDDTGGEPLLPYVSDEEVPSLSWDPGVCQIAMDCDASIPNDSKVGCDLVVADAAGTVSYDGRAAAEVRGRSSSGFPKQQFAVELRDSADAEREADLLGMGQDSDWILNGAWVDRALFRNKLTFDLFQALGGADEYAAETRFCELTLNGEYWGVYLLSERIKRGAGRIAISDADETDGSSFVLKLEESGGFYTNYLGYGSWTALYPRQETASTEALAGLTAAMDAWYGAATSTAPEDPDGGLYAVLDVQSAARFVMIEEFAKNNDAYYLSVHLWRDAGGLVHFVPWDIDLGYGQPSYNNNESPEEWVAYRPAFIDTLRRDPAFQEALSEAWATARADTLSDEAIDARIDGYTSVILEAQARNFERWPIEDVDFGGYLYPIESWEAEVARVRDWLDSRVAWMDEHIDTYGS